MDSPAQPSPAQTEGGRLPSLDGLRAIAALLVVFAHSHITEGWPGWLLLEELRKTLSGFVAVQMFFVISGFIITRLLLNERTKVGNISLRRFWARRFLRIVPPLAAYLGCLSLLKAFGAIEVSTLSQVGSLFFFRNHLPESDLFNIHCWSLSVEEQFYLIWPFCVAFLSLDKLHRVAWVVMVVALLTRTVTNAIGSTEWRWLIMQADCLMAGALAAFWLHKHGLKAVRPFSVGQNALHLAALGVVLMLTRASYTQISPWVAPIQPTAVAAFMAFWIVRLVSLREGWIFRWLNNPLMVWVGTISYSIYLWQELVSAPASHWLKGTPWFAHFPLNMLISIVAGVVSFYLLEKPLQALRHRWDSWLGVRSLSDSTPKAVS